MKIHLRDIVIGVLVLSILYLLFMHRPAGTNNEWKYEYRLLQDSARAINRDRTEARDSIDKLINYAQWADSMLKIQGDKIKIKNVKIAPYIMSLNKDSLRAAGERAGHDLP